MQDMLYVIHMTWDIWEDCWTVCKSDKYILFFFFLKGSTCFPQTHCIESMFLTVCIELIVGRRQNSCKTQEHRWSNKDRKAAQEGTRQKLVPTTGLKSVWITKPELKSKEAVLTWASDEGQPQPKSKGSSRSDGRRLVILIKGSPRCLEAGTGPHHQIHHEICPPGWMSTCTANVLSPETQGKKMSVQCYITRKNVRNLSFRLKEQETFPFKIQCSSPKRNLYILDA